MLTLCYILKRTHGRYPSLVIYNSHGHIQDQTRFPVPVKSVELVFIRDIFTSLSACIIIENFRHIFGRDKFPKILPYYFFHFVSGHPRKSFIYELELAINDNENTVLDIFDQSPVFFFGFLEFFFSFLTFCDILNHTDRKLRSAFCIPDKGNGYPGPEHRTVLPDVAFLYHESVFLPDDQFIEPVHLQFYIIRMSEIREHLILELSLIHISEPTRLRRISYDVFCLKKKKKQ